MQLRRFFVVIYFITTVGTNSPHQKDQIVEMPQDLLPTPESPSFENLFKHANQLFQSRKFKDSVYFYQKALSFNPNSAQAHFNMALALVQLKDIDYAIAEFERTIVCDPSHSKARVNLGKILKQKKLPDQAIEQYKQALSLDPSLLEASLSLARMYNDKHKFQDTINILQASLNNKPNEMTLLFELANTYNMMNKIETALKIYKRLEVRYPNKVSILYNIAYTLKKLGRLEEAFPYYDKVLRFNPTHAEAHFSRGLAYLVTGDFANGWQEYEWRWKRPQQGSYRTYPEPRWDGSDLDGKTIFLHAEQGLGDTIQFIRYARIAKERGGNVIVGVQKPLVDLLKLCPYIDHVIPLNEKPPPFDLHAPLMSLPYILGTTMDTIPTDIPYLYAKSELVEQWKIRLSSDSNVKIGICWQGNSQYSTPQLRAAVAFKSVTVNELSSLGCVPNVSVYSLQRITGTDQLKTLSPEFNLHTFDDDFDNSNGRFMDTAAVIKNLDLVITVDTSIGHLAAALGKPVWIILPNPPDWRWMLDRNDTPWYPSVRLFRQPTPGNWTNLIETVTKELRQFVHQIYKKSNRNNNEEKRSISSKPVHAAKQQYNWAEALHHLSMVTIALENTSNKTTTQELEIKRDHLNILTQNILTSDTVIQLYNDLTNINRRLLHTGNLLRSSVELSPLDDRFISCATTFYLLSELQKNILLKINTLMPKNKQEIF